MPMLLLSSRGGAPPMRIPDGAPLGRWCVGGERSPTAGECAHVRVAWAEREGHLREEQSLPRKNGWRARREGRAPAFATGDESGRTATMEKTTTEEPRLTIRGLATRRRWSSQPYRHRRQRWWWSVATIGATGPTTGLQRRPEGTDCRCDCHYQLHRPRQQHQRQRPQPGENWGAT